MSERSSSLGRHLARAVVLTAVAGLLAAPAGASAATPGCVTRAEFRAVHKGMLTARVHDIFDTAGKRLFINIGQVSNEAREYKVCGHPRSGGSFVQVQYNNYATNGGPRRLSFKQMQVH